MHVSIQAAILGVLIGVVLVYVEHSQLKKAAKERAERLHRPEEWGEMERGRVNTVLRFSLFLPPAFALGAWIIWG
jgi:hypothetical protein